MKFNTIEELLNYTEAIKGKTFKEIDYKNRTVVFSPPEGLDLDSISMDVPVGKEFVRACWKNVGGKVVPSLKLPSGWRCINKSAK